MLTAFNPTMLLRFDASIFSEFTTPEYLKSVALESRFNHIAEFAKNLFVIEQEHSYDKTPVNTVLGGRHCIEKLVIDGTVIKLGQKIITRTELQDFYDNDELMMLGLIQDTGELSWEAAPSWWRIVESDTLALYRVLDSAKRVPKTLKALPVNTQLPYSYVECNNNIDEEIQEALDAYKAQLMVCPEYEVYYELADKSGDIMRQGICKNSFLDKLKVWAEDIGGFYHVEAIC